MDIGKLYPLFLYLTLYLLVIGLSITWIKSCIYCLMSSFRMWEWPQKQAPEMALKKILIKISQYSQENTCTRVSFSVKLLASASNFIKRRDSGADILLYLRTPILQSVCQRLVLLNCISYFYCQYIN